MITVSETVFDPGEALRAFTQSCPDAGGIVSFTGHVRPTAKSGPAAKSGPVECLHLQVYSPMTEQGIEATAQEAKERWPLIDLRIIHRIGDMAPGEAIVFVATASAHRRAAFEAADFLMDYLKTKAIFWKRETGEHGSRWIEPRPEDYSDSARWATNGET